jgi:2-polyprenyl-3-methyl-5-hydroxy-6-metoxy-1,4-benzoquinol methylase
MTPFLKCKDHTLTQEVFELHQVAEGDMLVTHPVPDNLAKYYESIDYISHTDAKNSVLDWVYQWVKSYSLKRKERLLCHVLSGDKNLLDIGAGTGDFLLHCKNQAWQVSGVEPNAAARGLAQRKGIALYEDLASVSTKKFQAITLWHVLEHLPDLYNDIARIYDLLETDGVLVIAVPNYKAYDAKKYGAYWAAYDVPRHLWHFSQAAIKRIFESRGFRLLETKPMPFDAYYVSLLSEKYKTGKQRWWAAFRSGWTSNAKAKRSGEYSSLIYILQKAK